MGHTVSPVPHTDFYKGGLFSQGSDKATAHLKLRHLLSSGKKGIMRIDFNSDSGKKAEAQTRSEDGGIQEMLDRANASVNVTMLIIQQYYV